MWSWERIQTTLIVMYNGNNIEQFSPQATWQKFCWVTKLKHQKHHHYCHRHFQKQWQQLGYRLIGTYLVIGIRRRHHSTRYQLEKGGEQILRELSVNVISLLTICVKREIREWQFSPSIVILSEKTCQFQPHFMYDCWNYVNQTWTEIHNIKQ